jgi:hypothetical protein
MIILYKNSSRIGFYADCIVKPCVEDGYAFNGLSGITDDCVVPPCVQSGQNVRKCKLKVKISNLDTSVLDGDATHLFAPEVFIRTDRGAWSAFRDNCSYILPVGSSIRVQICTKEKTHTMKSPLCLVFMDGDEMVAKSEAIIVLSKPPTDERTFPFARIESRKSTTQRSPSKWILGSKDLVISPVPKSETVVSWRVAHLGSHRVVTVPAEKLQKRPREDDFQVPSVNLEAELLKEKLKEAEMKIISLETEKQGLAKALSALQH